MQLFHSMKSRLIFFSLCISIIPIVSITVIFYLHAKSNLKRQQLDKMTAVVESKKFHLMSFMEAKLGRVIDFSSDGFIKECLEIINRGGVDKDNAIASLDKHLSLNKKPLDPDILDTVVLDREGNVVASTSKTLMEMNMSHHEIYTRAISKRPGEAHVVQPCCFSFLNVGCLPLSAPVFSRNRTDAIGVIINLYDLASLNEITTGITGMGKTGEVYLVNKYKKMLTQSMFIGNSPLRLKVDTEPVQKIIRESKEMTGLYTDYRNIPVVGASAYIPEYGWMLLAEIDKTEAFAPIKTMGIVVLIIWFVSTAAVTGFGIIIALSTTRPVERLTEATKKLTEGDLTCRVKAGRKDEIGSLAESFNRMANGLSREISGHRQALGQLRKSEASLANAQRIARIGSWEWNIVTNNEYWSDETYCIFGFTPRAFVPTYQTLLDSVHPDDIEFVKKSVSDALYENKPYTIDFRLLLKDGTVRFVHSQGEVIFDGTGKPLQMNGTIQDITERKQIEERLKKTVEEKNKGINDMRRLMDFSNLMREEIQERTLISHMAMVLKEHFLPDSLVVFMLNKEVGMIEIPITYPALPYDKVIKQEVMLDPVLCRVIRTGQSLIVNDVDKDFCCNCLRLDVKEGGYACFPIAAEGYTIGAVHLAKKERHFWENEENHRLISTYAGLASSSLDNIRLMNLTKQLAITDTLTHIYNRRFFDESLEKQLALSKRHNEPLAVIIADIDHFKGFNDTYGHPAGDQILRKASEIMKDSLRESDILCRYGGEEFVIMMPKTEIGKAFEKAENIRRRLEAENFISIVSGKPLKITMSMGIASFPENGAECSVLLDIADNALYKAKRNGRNRVEMP